MFAVTVLFSQTRIKDQQEVSGTWKVSKSPYIIEGEAIVPKGKTLKIKPGVVIMFKTGTERDYSINYVKNKVFDLGFLRVNGKIIAEGKPDKLIKFTRVGTSGYWGNVHIRTDVKDNLFKYCLFEAAYFIREVIEGGNATGALSFYNSTGTVKNCLFIDNGWTAINCKESSAPILDHLTIVANKYGIECNSNSSPKISNSILWNTETAFYSNGGSNPGIKYSLVQGSFLEEIQDLGNNMMGIAPDFIDPSTLNYGINKSSPAYKKGSDGNNIGAL